MGEAGANSQLTPMIRQYLEIKEQYSDYILFYRMGDFYEMFFSDAETASRELEITLTARNKHEKTPVPMCGVPVKSAEIYLGRLIDKGYKVAVCEQTEDPAEAKGLVKRDVVRVVTPGMVVNSELLDAHANNFIMSAVAADQGWGLCCLDISTGSFKLCQCEDAETVIEEARRIAPSEILLPASAENGPVYQCFLKTFQHTAVSYLDDEVFSHEQARQRLIDQFRTRSLEGFGCEGLKAGVSAAGALLHYVQDTQKQEITHLSGLETYFPDRYLRIDDTSCRNLELLASLQTGGRQATLLSVLDHTVTAMGARLMKRWIRYPLIDPEAIADRHEAVEQAVDYSRDRGAIRSELKSVADLERLGSKLAMGQGNARDLAALRRSIEALPGIRTLLKEFDAGVFEADESIFPQLAELAGKIGRAVVDDPPQAVNEGGMIRQGFDEDLDELISIARDSKSWLARLEAEERQQTGIQTLKVSYNRVFGYYIEVSRTHADSVPEHYVRKQTLVNAERYITDELKSFENKVLGAQEKRAVLEYEIFCRLKDEVAACNRSVQSAADFAARTDVICSLAEAAVHNNYVRPQISKSHIRIEDGRHPVVEKLMAGSRFVPNTVSLDDTENQVLIITGPNMAGKSTVMRQVALIVIMAQMGSFVPASGADIAVTDRIFTRVGALDNLSQGQSTFMVEMEETSNIMNNATPDSLVIMDEIGRGTSTYDGLSIAWAVAEYLHDLKGRGVKSMFATHYHELTDLPRVRKRVKNYSIAVREINDEIIFLHQLVAGGTNRSYGIQVARLAGMPEKVVERARKVLENVERQGHVLGRDAAGRAGRQRKEQKHVQLPLFRGAEEAVIEKIRQADISRMTPLEALNYLNMLQEKINGIRGPEGGRLAD